MKRLVILLLLLAPSIVRAQLSTTPGWHKLPSTALCGGGAENNASYSLPNNFPANLGPYTSYGFNFQANCYEALEDSNGGVFDSTRNRLIIWGGGHQHYWGNDAWSVELNNVGTGSPVMVHLDYSANPATIIGSTSTVETLGPCTFATGCVPTTNSPGSRHTYEGIDYVPTLDEFVSIAGVTSPLGNSSNHIWTFPMGNLTPSCAPTGTTVSGCDPQWTDHGTFTPSNVGITSVYDPNTQLIFLQTQSGFFSFNPTNNTVTQRNTQSYGYHSSAIIDPEDKFYILLGAQQTSPPEGLHYYSIATGSTFTLLTPPTITPSSCAALIANGVTIPSGPQAGTWQQYQGMDWDPIGHRVAIYPNGTNTIVYIYPKTWTCSTETYGATQGTDYPQNTIICPGANPGSCSGANGTFTHFRYSAQSDVFVLCNDPFNDCWYLRPNRVVPDTITITDTSGTMQTNRPITIARAFAQGEIISGGFAQASIGGVALLTQCDVKNRWPDGTLKFALVSFIVPSIPANGTVTVMFSSQGTGNNTGFLAQSDMLGAAYNFDATMALTGTANSPTIHARSILSGASCNPGGTDPDNGNSKCTYWLQGPIVTAIVLEDRSGRSFDVNTDNATGNPLHPIFEAWFYPQNNMVQVGYTLENSWASTTPTNAARDQTYSVTVTVGNTSPVQVFSNPSFTQTTRSRWHRTSCLGASGSQNYCGGTVTVNQNWPYLATTKFTPYWDPSLTIAASKISSEVNGFSTTNQSLTGNANGIGYFPGPNQGGMNATGAGEYHGPLTTWDIITLMSQDPGMLKVTLGNADLGNAIPYFYREADTNAGHGQTFDNSGVPGNVNTQGRVVSINARTQFSSVDVTQQTCNTVFAPDWVNFGGTGQDTGVWGIDQMDESHWPNLAYASYLLTGQYAYYEEQLMQAAYAVAGSPGARACINAAGGANRQGTAGYWYIDQERGTDWQARENFLGAFIAIDGSPEKAYLEDKLRANLAVWEGVHNITLDVPGSYTAAWNFGNTVRINYPAQGTPLGSWTQGPSTGASGAYPPNYPLCYANTTVPCPSPQWSNPPFGANANFQNAYSTVILGWINDLGYCPQPCQFLAYTANHFLNEALNPASNQFHLSDYVYPTLDHTGNQITTWAQDQTFYVPGGQATSWPACPNNPSADEWYVAENTSAMSYLSGMFSSQGGYSGATAYNNMRNVALGSCISTFATFSPKWDIVPRTTTIAQPPPPIISMSPSPLTFPQQVVTTTSPVTVINLSNTGSATLILTTPFFTLSGTNATDFAVCTTLSASCTAISTCANGGTLVTGASCSVVLTFSPSVLPPASETATLTINGNATGNDTLNGTGVVVISIQGSGTISGSGSIKP